MILSFFLSGIAMAMFSLAGLFFLKFWKVSRDKFFIYLCTACWLLALERVAGLVLYLALPNDDATVGMTRGWIYTCRLIASLVIIFAVVAKNREKSH